MPVSSRLPYRLPTRHRICSPRVLHGSLLLIIALSMLGCRGSNGADADSADVTENTITGITLAVTLPPGFDPDEMTRMELSVTGPGVPADLPIIPLDPSGAVSGNRTMLAFAFARAIPPGPNRVFTLQAFPTRHTAIPTFLGQETVEVSDTANTQVVMTILPAIAQLSVRPSFINIVVGATQQFRALGLFGADCRTNDPSACAILIQSDLTTLAGWSVTPPPGQPAIASISNGPDNRGRALGTAQGAAAVTATVESLDDGGILHVREAMDIPSIFVTITRVALSEGDAGEREITLTVKLSVPNNTNDISIDFATADSEDAEHRATANADYLSTQGTLTFSRGETERQISISIHGDRDPEPDEQFRVVLSNPQPAEVLLLSSEVDITIINDDKAA